MTERLPLGERENDSLELKSRNALNEPRIISRAVVAFLNTKGGTVWVGLGEEGGRAVRFEPIDDVGRARDRLVDALADTIEPAPSTGTVRVEPVETDEGSVLRIDVERGSHPPYAVTKNGGRFFWTRLGASTRPMAREEIARAFTEAFTQGAEGDLPGSVEAAKQRALAKRRQVEDADRPLLWMTTIPAAKLTLDVQDERLVALLEEPERSGNRRGGWTVIGRGLAGLGQGRIEVRWPPAEWEAPETPQKLVVLSGGPLEYSGPLEVLERTQGRKDSDRPELWPYALLELPISFLRLAARVYEGVLDADEPVVVDILLTGVRGWVLRPSSPSAPWRPGWIRYDYASQATECSVDELALLEPMVVRSSELTANPDRVGFRLIRQIYESFGYSEEAIPSELDRTSGRLSL